MEKVKKKIVHQEKSNKLAHRKFSLLSNLIRTYTWQIYHLQMLQTIHTFCAIHYQTSVNINHCVFTLKTSLRRCPTQLSMFRAICNISLKTRLRFKPINSLYFENWKTKVHPHTQLTHLLTLPLPYKQNRGGSKLYLFCNYHH